MSEDLTAQLMARAVHAQEQCAESYAEATRRWRADRRERIATAALQGLLACPGPADFEEGPFRVLSAGAVAYADALIEELDKENGR